MADAFDPAHLFDHVQDQPYFEVPKFFDEDGHWDIPQPFVELEDTTKVGTEVHTSPGVVQPFDGMLTKFMLVELAVALVMCLLFIRLAQRMAGGRRPQGLIWNFLEAIVVFLRDEVARPAIGKHDADRFMPFLLTMFFFVLGCNLLGMVPWLGTATAALATTGALALITFLAVIGTGMSKLGVAGFWKAQVPPMDLGLELGGINFEPALKAVLLPMIFTIEVIGLLIKHFVLAVRLLANMLAGHLVLAVILAFIAAYWQNGAIWGVAPASILGATALSMLELFVAFLQAYIFAFLSALFIGMAVHPH